MRIAYFSHYLTPRPEGQRQALQRQAAHQRAQGHALCWVTTVEHPPLPEPQPVTGRWNLWRYAFYCLGWGADQLLLAQLQAFRPDVVHIDRPDWLGWMATRLARQLHIPCVATYPPASVGPSRPRKINAWPPLRRWRDQLILNACTRTLVPCRAVQRALQVAGIGNTRLLPPGVNLEAFHPRFRSATWREPFGADACILLYVEPLEWQHNLALLAEVLPGLLARRPHVHFVFVGEGPARAQLEALLPHAHFLENLSAESLAMAYASCDALVSPTTTATSSSVTLEAMASELPCLVAHGGASAEVVEDGTTGLFFTPACAATLAQQFRVLTDNPEGRRMGQLARTHAQTRSWDGLLAQQWVIYEELLTGYPAAAELPPQPLSSSLTKGAWLPPPLDIAESGRLRPSLT